MDTKISIGTLARRSGVTASALRYYEAEGLLRAERTPSGQRRFHRDAIRRVAFIRVAQEVGLTLEEIRHALQSLPDVRTPTRDDWTRLSRSWRPRLDAQIRMLERLRDRLDSCIGCGCLSLEVCRLANPDDEAGRKGPGPRHLLDDR